MITEVWETLASSWTTCPPQSRDAPWRELSFPPPQPRRCLHVHLLPSWPCSRSKPPLGPSWRLPASSLLKRDALTPSPKDFLKKKFFNPVPRWLQKRDSWRPQWLQERDSLGPRWLQKRDSVGPQWLPEMRFFWNGNTSVNIYVNVGKVIFWNNLATNRAQSCHWEQC